VVIDAQFVILAVCVCALAACTTVLWRRSLPAALERRQKRVEGEVADLTSAVDSIGRSAASWKAQGETLRQEIEDYFDRIETKRRSTAASTSRAAVLAQGAPADTASLPRAEQIARARAQVGSG